MDQKLVAVKNVKNLRFPWKWEVSTWPAVQLLTPPGKIISNELHISDRLAFRDNSLSAPAYPITSNRKKITLYCWREILMFWFVASFVGFFYPRVCTELWTFAWPVYEKVTNLNDQYWKTSVYIAERLLTVKQKSRVDINVRQLKEGQFISTHSKKRTRTIHKPTANKMKYYELCHKN